MSGKIYLAILTAALIAIITCFIFNAIIAYSNILESRRTLLKNELQLVSAGVEQGGLAYLDAVKMPDFRITWVEPDGRVRFESHARAESLENHLAREEIAQAMNSGSGEICRTSPTFLKSFCYAAKRLNNGSVLRLGISADTVLALLLDFLAPALYALLGIAVIAIFIARKLAKNIIAPLSRINLDSPFENDTYPEMAPFLRRINRQQQQIKEQARKIQQDSEDFVNITSSMREGLVVLDSSFRIISMNASARDIFSAEDGCIGRNFLQTDRNMALNKILASAMQKGVEECRLERHERIYHARINRVDKEGRPAGLALLMLDITEEAQTEMRRHEFSANVSHELKTPLQTIIGSAELLKDGIVEAGDISRFAGKIHGEALRLLKLTDDIIHLSSLDTQTPYSDAEFDLCEIALSCCQNLLNLASEKNIGLSVKGERAIIYGSKILAEEIVYNLCENAIKYNRDNGFVEVSVSGDEEGIFLSVKDNGIGIAQEECERIFDRFYRCDKSHSRAVGGSGLGLSIVKQAAKYFNARITVKSEPDKGSVFTAAFPHYDEDAEKENVFALKKSGP